MKSALRSVWGSFHPRTRRALFIGSTTGTILVVLWLMLSLAMAYSLTRRKYARRSESVPTVTGFQIEDSRVQTRDGEDIAIWFVDASTDRPIVLLIHGNGGNRESCWPRAKLLLQNGYSILLISCRAHGDSSGEYNDCGWSARLDVIAAAEWLRQRQPGKRLILWGASLGSAAAVFAASELNPSVDAIILECPYRDLDTAVWNRCSNQLPPVLDFIAYAGLRMGAIIFLPRLSEISPINSIDKIPHQARVLILAGQEDTRARPAEATALHERIKSRSQLKIFKGADHLKLQQTAASEYERVILDFVRQVD